MELLWGSAGWVLRGGGWREAGGGGAGRQGGTRGEGKSAITSTLVSLSACYVLNVLSDLVLLGFINSTLFHCCFLSV